MIQFQELFIVLLIQSVAPECSDEFPINTPILDDPCTFIRCYNGTEERMRCPNGFYFDEETNVCVKSNDTLCQLDVDVTDETERMKKCQNHNKLFRNPDNCSTYYSCSNGIAILMNCPDSLLFNEDRQQCVWPDDAKCCENNC